MKTLSFIFILLSFACSGSGTGGGGGTTPTPTETPGDDEIPPTPTATPASPQVRARVPASGATSVATNTIISAAFDRAMDPTTFTSSSFHADVAGSPVPASSPVYTAADKTVTLTPSADFAISTPVTVHLTTAIKDATGVALSTAVSWTFTTGLGPDNTAPTPFSGLTSAAVVDVAKIKLDWSAATDDQTPASSITYKIYESPSTLIASVTGAVTYTTGHMPSGTYTYRVQARDTAGNETTNTTDQSATITIPPSTFTQVYALMSTGTKTCTDSECHDHDLPKKNQDLSSQALAFSNIVNVTSEENPPMKRIEPNDPDNSYLYLKLSGAGEQAQMPKDKTPFTVGELNTVRYWILNGALNN